MVWLRCTLCLQAEIAHAASAMGYGAVKYADLKNSRLTNYKFSFDAMLALKGNTAVYLLYAHARIAGIVRKGGKDLDELAKTTKIVLGTPQEVRSMLYKRLLRNVFVDDLMLQRLPGCSVISVQTT